MIVKIRFMRICYIGLTKKVIMGSEPFELDLKWKSIKIKMIRRLGVE